MNIININNFDISKLGKEAVLAIDTNALLWTFYSRTTYTKSYQKSVYANFISKLIANGNTIIIGTYNLNEMFHVIEKNEFDIYKQANNIRIRLKDFRAISSERIKIKQEIELIYKQIIQIPNVKIIGSNADIVELKAFIDKYDAHNCDFFDFWLIKYCNENNCSILTDDCDFNNPFNSTDLYTANPNVV